MRTACSLPYMGVSVQEGVSVQGYPPPPKEHLDQAARPCEQNEWQIGVTSNASKHCVTLPPSCLNLGHDLDSYILIWLSSCPEGGSIFIVLHSDWFDQCSEKEASLILIIF